MPVNVNPRNPQEPGNQDGEDYGTYQGGGDTGSGSEGCGPGLIQTGLGADGQVLSGNPECVSAAEADRRRNVHSPGWESGGYTQEGGGVTGGTGGGQFPKPSGQINYGPVPQFNGPAFQWNEQFQAPTYAEIENDQGYQFRRSQGQRGMEASAAARGNLRTGGTLKALADYNQQLASQEYGNVYNRRAGEYGMRYGQARDKYGYDYTLARDQFAPKMTEYLTKANGANLGFQNQWSNYWKNNLSASELAALLGGYV
jgi:hypothetical protein